MMPFRCHLLRAIESRELACEDSDVDLLHHGQDQEQNFTKFLNEPTTAAAKVHEENGMI